MSASPEGTPPRWPDGARYAVVVTVNFDAELVITGPEPSAATLQKTLSIFRYGGLRGAPRFLEVFADRGVHATWFVPGAIVREYRGVLERVVAHGHGLGARGERLERFDTLPESERLRVLRAAHASLVELAPPGSFGFRLPGGEWPPGLGAQLLDVGFTWSSSWVGDDLPFFLPAGEGRAVVEVPFAHVLDDRRAFAWNFSPPIPLGHSRIPSYEEVLESWLYELEGCRREGLCLVLQLHPEVTGTPGRIDLVRRFLDATLRDGEAWVATGAEVASWWAAAHGADQPGHPVELLRRVSPATLW